jgi:Kef-type K+ transport system membrane component KefB
LAIEFYLAILLMLVTAWVLGELLHRVGQPVIVGQLIAGVIIGPSILNVVQPTTQLSTVENVALFFLMLLTGLAVKPAR